jgi:hypothetical protein
VGAPRWFYNNSLKSLSEPDLSIEMSTRGDAIAHLGLMVQGSARPDVEQLAIMNDILGYISDRMGVREQIRVTSSQFSHSYSAIREAPVRRVGPLLLRMGSVAGDAILSVDLVP